MNFHESKFKTRPLKHQAHYLTNYAGRKYFALFAEQGTGKSWMLINEAAQLWESGDIEEVLIIAPNGVHENWTRPVIGQFAQHCPDWVNWKSIAWNASNSNRVQKERNEFIADNQHRKLRIYSFNWESIQNERGQEEVLRFIRSSRSVMVILDESDSMKDPQGLRAKFLEKLKKDQKITYKKICTGTPINNSPFDAYSQFRFLNTSILETDSFRAFKTEYGKCLPPQHGLIRNIVGKKVKLDINQLRDIHEWKKKLMYIIDNNGRTDLIHLLYDSLEANDSGCDELFIERLQKLKASFNPESNAPQKVLACSLIDSICSVISGHLRKMTSAMNPNRIPLIVERDKENKPIYRNLDKLAKLIEPHSWRVLRSECLDLPDKIYETLFFHLTQQQKEVYRLAEEECRMMFEGKTTPFSRLTAVTKLSQITSGYYLHPASDNAVRINGRNPKLELLVERCKNCVERGEKFIVWARYTVEIDDISEALTKEGITNAKYYGKTKRVDRLDIIDKFEQKDELIALEGEVEVWKKSGLDGFIGNQKAGGTGITLINAREVHYYSNDFSYRNRIQSEDRSMRIGQTKDVTYFNYAAIGTIDEYVILCLLNKQDVAFTIIDKGRRGELFNLGNKLLTA